MHSVTPAKRSRRKTSARSFESPAKKFFALLWNTTRFPSTDTLPFALWSSPSSPEVEMLTRSIKPVVRSFTKTSASAFVSPGTSSPDQLKKQT